VEAKLAGAFANHAFWRDRAAAPPLVAMMRFLYYPARGFAHVSRCTQANAAERNGCRKAEDEAGVYQQTA